ncbi:hypothetical protein MES4922_130001 [Mesorhizobium ventifaucium]|uniref:Uncharacterized protein n=1 Tax=Mesorhizobium ventifaucium TaxID=666020 RepID=A0ABN8JCX5_9HYPH|nr:hypothetical protein MES4922_130001 [Mesorhizobium ventifaucium]
MRTWRADVAESVDAAGLNPAGIPVASSNLAVRTKLGPHQSRAAPNRIWRGGRARLNAPASKAGRPAGLGGSNPSPAPGTGGSVLDT